MFSVERSAFPASRVSGRREFPDAEDFAGVADFAGDGGGGDHERAHQDGAARRAALAALEVAVGGRGAELVADELGGIHRETHGAARAAPLETRVAEDLGGPQFLAEE